MKLFISEQSISSIIPTLCAICCDFCAGRAYYRTYLLFKALNQCLSKRSIDRQILPLTLKNKEVVLANSHGRRCLFREWTAVKVLTPLCMSLFNCFMWAPTLDGGSNDRLNYAPQLRLRWSMPWDGFVFIQKGIVHIHKHFNYALQAFE